VHTEGDAAAPVIESTAAPVVESSVGVPGGNIPLASPRDTNYTVAFRS
jgi:hypothetical protein